MNGGEEVRNLPKESIKLQPKREKRHITTHEMLERFVKSERKSWSEDGAVFLYYFRWGKLARAYRI